MPRRLFWIFLLATAAVFLARPAARAEVQTLFAGTPYALKVHVLDSYLPGPTILVQGGIQGDEPAGFLTAERLTHYRPRNGRLIIIPRANPPSVHNHARLMNVDLNRRFDTDYNEHYEDVLARAIRLYIAQADAFIHLHEGWGFHSPTWVNARRNPRRFGQSIVIDTPVFAPASVAGKGPIHLAEYAKAVLDRLNPTISPASYRFSLMSTDTFNPRSSHAEQTKSLTCYALSTLGIPALAIEVSKDIRALDWKVDAQLKATLLALERFGMSMRHPETLPRPTDRELLAAVRINGRPAADAEHLELALGQPIRVEAQPMGGQLLGIFASDRPEVDILATPRAPQTRFDYVEIRVDGRRLTRLPVRWVLPGERNAPADRLVLWLNDTLHTLTPGQTLDAVEGDILLLEGMRHHGQKTQEVINLKGFVSNLKSNDGQDAGSPIILAPDMFRQRYVKTNEKSGVHLCRIVRETPGLKRSERHTYYVRVKPRAVHSVTLTDAYDTILRLPCDARLPAALAPGRYWLESVESNGRPGGVQAVVASRSKTMPLAQGGSFVVAPGQRTVLELKQTSTLQPLNSITIAPVMTVQKPQPVAQRTARLPAS